MEIDMLPKLSKKRAERRHRTALAQARREAVHRALVHNHSGDVCKRGDVCEHDHLRRYLACECSKRRHGRPKLAAGMCCVGERDRIFDWRHEARDLAVAALAGRL